MAEAFVHGTRRASRPWGRRLAGRRHVVDHVADRGRLDEQGHSTHTGAGRPLSSGVNACIHARGVFTAGAGAMAVDPSGPTA
jgi:hypothetical protein